MGRDINETRCRDGEEQGAELAARVKGEFSVWKYAARRQ